MITIIIISYLVASYVSFYFFIIRRTINRMNKIFIKYPISKTIIEILLRMVLRKNMILHFVMTCLIMAPFYMPYYFVNKLVKWIKKKKTKEIKVEMNIPTPLIISNLDGSADYIYPNGEKKHERQENNDKP